MPWKESSVMDERMRFVIRLKDGYPPLLRSWCLSLCSDLALDPLHLRFSLHENPGPNAKHERIPQEPGEFALSFQGRSIPKMGESIFRIQLGLP